MLRRHILTEHQRHTLLELPTDATLMKANRETVYRSADGR